MTAEDPGPVVDFTLARVVHVAAVLMWIGGVAFVTTVLFPSIARAHPPDERLEAFHRFERPFAGQARIWVLLAGASGFWMAWRADMWSRFLEVRYWWMHAMVIVWLGFSLMLFVIEPLVLHKRMENSVTPAADFDRMSRMHRRALAVSMIALAGAVGGSHGLF